jgi:hypothetical protein
MRLALLFALVAAAHAFHAPMPAVRATAGRPAVRIAMSDEKVPVTRPKSGLGRTVDQDGKSNVWAVEPKMRVDNSDFNAADPKIVAGGIAAILAIVAIPLFPTLFSGANAGY